ncbi:MAG TPA: bacteriohemerythrin [Thermoanaerobaculia bacterium]|nr:bacteriohemerythrin [Thermoanaerobaculia bacterium]HUM30398.1 bacteriohemerythrin [Thermoanaerobaculia bacterium]HXK68591.1 bacteriohemerythrin [Thermoanaerobaculia bacterium]
MSPTFRPYHETGISMIDEQHRVFFSKLNDLFAACKAGTAGEELRPMLDYLVSYVQTHLATEEQFMSEHRYPEKKEHEEQHRIFRDKMYRMRTRFLSAPPSVDFILELNRTLVDWFQSHINDQDVKMGAFLRDKVS